MGSEKTRAEKLFSLSGVVPLGAFVLYHVWLTSALLASHATFDRQSAVLHASGVFTIFELALVVVPLVFHAVYGIGLALGKSKEHAYDNDLMRSLERVSGVVVLLFVLWHAWQTRVPTLDGSVIAPTYSTHLTELLSSTTGGIPFIALGYLVGLAATIFHLVNGLTSFCATWGFPRPRMLFRALGILFFAVSSATVLELATGTRIVPAEPPPPGTCAPSESSHGK